MQKKGTSWGVIIALLIFFWPVGLFLLVRKLATDRSAALKPQVGVTVLGIVLLVIGLMGWAVEGTLFNDGGRIALFFLVGGVAALWYGHRARKRAARYRSYINIVVNQGISGIDAIARAAGVPVATCEKELVEMVEHNYFPGGRVDLASRQLVRSITPITPPPVMQRPVQAPVQPVYGTPHGAAPRPVQPVVAPPPQPRVVKCGGCGANNTVVGTGECEYCGTPIQ